MKENIFIYFLKVVKYSSIWTASLYRLSVNCWLLLRLPFCQVMLGTRKCEGKKSYSIKILQLIVTFSLAFKLKLLICPRSVCSYLVGIIYCLTLKLYYVTNKIVLICKCQLFYFWQCKCCQLTHKFFSNKKQDNIW